MKVAHCEAVESRPSVNLAIFEAINSQLDKQVLMEISIVEQFVPRVIDGIEGELQFGSE